MYYLFLIVLFICVFFIPFYMFIIKIKQKREKKEIKIHQYAQKEILKYAETYSIDYKSFGKTLCYISYIDTSSTKIYINLYNDYFQFNAKHNIKSTNGLLMLNGQALKAILYQLQRGDIKENINSTYGKM